MEENTADPERRRLRLIHLLNIIKRKDKERYYSLKDIDNSKALYRLIIGKKSNGKTYGVCQKLIKEYFNTKNFSVYLRRYVDDIRPMNIKDLLKPHEGLIKKLSKGEYNTTVYKNNAFCPAFRNADGEIEYYNTEQPIIYTASLAGWEHKQGADRGQCSYIFFDEFCSRLKYLPDEFITFSKVISTYMRDRPLKAVYMCSNTVNTYCPYWAEMGIYNIEKLNKGEIAFYQFSGETSVAVEYCADSDNTKEINKYFAFENPRLNMIFNGDWEIANYRHPKGRYTKEDIYFTFFVKFQGHTVKGTVYKKGVHLFLLFHPCGDAGKITDNTLLYTDEPITSIYHSNSFTHCHNERQRLINNLINTNRDYYTNNSIGELVTNFRKEAQKIAI